MDVSAEKHQPSLLLHALSLFSKCTLCSSGLKSPNAIGPLTLLVCVNAPQLADTCSSGALNLAEVSAAAGSSSSVSSSSYRNRPANRHVSSAFPPCELMLPCCLHQAGKCGHHVCSIRPGRQNSSRGHPTASENNTWSH